MLLIIKGILKVLTDVEVDSHDKKNYVHNKAQSAISLSMENNLIIHNCNCKAARDVWEVLQNVHQIAILSNKLYLLKKLYQTKLDSGQMM